MVNKENTSSPGEDMIASRLRKMHIKYKKEYDLGRLKGDTKNYRRADFFLPEYDAVIEYLGLWEKNQIEKDRYNELKRVYTLNKINAIYVYPNQLHYVDKVIQDGLLRIGNTPVDINNKKLSDYSESRDRLSAKERIKLNILKGNHVIQPDELNALSEKNNPNSKEHHKNNFVDDKNKQEESRKPIIYINSEDIEYPKRQREKHNKKQKHFVLIIISIILIIMLGITMILSVHKTPEQTQKPIANTAPSQATTIPSQAQVVVPPIQITTDKYSLIVANNEDVQIKLNISYKRYSNWFGVDEDKNIVLTVDAKAKTTYVDPGFSQNAGCINNPCYVSVLSYQRID